MLKTRFAMVQPCNLGSDCWENTEVVRRAEGSLPLHSHYGPAWQAELWPTLVIITGPILLCCLGRVGTTGRAVPCLAVTPGSQIAFPYKAALSCC